MLRLRNASSIRALTLSLLLCVLALRVIIPAGYMLDRAPGGWPRLIACPAAAPAPVAVHTGHHAAPHGHHQHDQKTADHPCAFATASAAVDLAAVPLTSAPSHVRADAAVATLYVFARPGLGLAAPPPPKTGPPATA